jgi:ATP-dependent protease Clp ATPase subunit
VSPPADRGCLNRIRVVIHSSRGLRRLKGLAVARWTLRFTDYPLEAIAEAVLARKIGARGLRMIIEDLTLDLMYNLPGQQKIRECVITREVVQSKEMPITLIEKAG